MLGGFVSSFLISSFSLSLLCLCGGSSAEAPNILRPASDSSSTWPAISTILAWRDCVFFLKKQKEEEEGARD